MNVLLVDQLKPGCVVGRDLVDANGRILLVKGVALTQSYIDVLREKGYTRLYVKDDGPDVDVEDDINPLVRSRAMETLRETFDSIEQELMALRARSQEEVLAALKSEHVRALMNQKALLDRISAVASELMDEVLTRRTLAGLTSLKTRDGALYDHSLDVCAVAIMIGNAININTARMRQLAIGCLLHDIGMLFFPRDSEDEFRRVRRHTVLGYELLKATDESDILAPYVAYEHHEHQDGSGLPRGLKGSNQIQRPRGQSSPVLTLIGEIAAVANHYDNLLSGVGGAQPAPPDEAITAITGLAGSWFNKDVVAALRRVAPVYPRGTQVILRGNPYDRFAGIVSRVNHEQLDRPWIIIARDAAGNKVEPEEIDCRQHEGLLLRITGF